MMDWEWALVVMGIFSVLLVAGSLIIIRKDLGQVFKGNACDLCRYYDGQGACEFGYAPEPVPKVIRVCRFFKGFVYE